LIFFVLSKAIDVYNHLSCPNLLTNGQHIWKDLNILGPSNRIGSHMSILAKSKCPAYCHAVSSGNSVGE
jgi:hypothetical protein